MPISAGPLWVFAALLAVAGAAKVGSPSTTSGALSASGLPSSRRAVQLLGIAEIAVGIYAIVIGDAASGAAVALFYLAFTWFVMNALVRDLPVASCGCFGKEDTPPSWIHVALTILGVAAGVVVMLQPPGGIAQLIAFDGESILFLLLTGVAFSFAYISLTTLPKTLGAAKRP